MFIALSTFTIANDMAAEVRQAFKDRPHMVDKEAGFLRLEVMYPQENENEIWLMTYWTDEESYKVWFANHYKDSHHGIPKGLKLVPGSTKVKFLEHVCG
jgi:heme oxygenase (mycobilin-producing)